MKLFIIMIQQGYFYEQLIKMILRGLYLFLLILINYQILNFFIYYHFMTIQ